MSRAADRPGVAADATDEIRSLRRDLRDLVAVLSLPLTWRGRTPSEIMRNLADVLMSLSRLDFLHLRLEPGDDDGEALEQTRDRRREGEGPSATELLESILPGEQPDRGRGDEDAWAGDIAVGEGRGSLRLARIAPGVHPGRWRVVAGSYRDDFPTERERFLMRVTVEQAAVGIETATLFQQAQEASTAKSQFIATMSHELRTPLNAILGYVDLLLLGIPTALPEDCQAHVGRVQSSAHHLLDMIDSILSFARIEAGHEKLNREEVDLAALVSGTVQLLEPLAREKDLAFECSTPVEAVSMPTDAAKVRQILFNLVSNAIKFTDEGGVAVTMEASDDSIAIHVRDTGLGIPPEERSHVFEPFRQVEGSLTRRTGGTGLGLSVARHLSEILGGSLELESEVGEGSTFTVRLPREGPPTTSPKHDGV